MSDSRSASSSVPLADIDAFVFDCDGVLWRGAELVPGADVALRQLRALGKKIVFVTNNSVRDFTMLLRADAMPVIRHYNFF